MALQPTMSLEQKTEMSKQTYDMIHADVIERYGRAIVKSTQETSEFAINWFPKRGGRQVSMIVNVNPLGGLKIRFSRNALEGIIWKEKTPLGHLYIRLADKICIKIVDTPELAHLRVNLYPDKTYAADKTARQLAVKLVNVILAA
jgi:hypothetical protein